MRVTLIFIVCPTASKYLYIKKEWWREKERGEGKGKRLKRSKVERRELGNGRRGKKGSGEVFCTIFT